MTSTEETTTSRWSARGLMARIGLAIVLPALVGGLVASFVPWPEWRWPSFAIASQLAALATWLWLYFTVGRRLRNVARALEPGGERLSLSRGGGLAGIVDAASARLSKERELERGVERLEVVRASLAQLTESAGQWADTERAPAFPTEGVPEEVQPLVDRLALAASRLDERAFAARAVAGQVRESVADAGMRSGQVAAAAERQFIEASSLLTVLRGLERWGTDLQVGVEALATALELQIRAAGAAQKAAEDAARGAAAQLDAAQRASDRVRQAARDLERVHEDSQFAALESAHVALTAWSPGAERLADALTVLIRATRAAQERALELEQKTVAEMAAAHEEFGALKARLAAVGSGDAGPDARELPRRALERVHEMVRDAISRGERLVQQAERTSSEALRAGEGVTAAVDEVDGLAARFAEAHEEPPPAAALAVEPEPLNEDEPALPDDEDEGHGPHGRPLRVLGPEDLLPDDETWSHG
jgi:hypothetical protein